MTRPTRLCLIPLLLIGCAHVGHGSTSSRGVIVSMTRLSVTPTPENNPGARWDEGRQANDDDDGCGLLIALDFVAPGVGTLASVACSLSESGSGASDFKPEDPDLYVAFKLGSTTYTSPVISDRASHVLPYSLFIPNEVLRDNDLHVAVHDLDGEGQSTFIAERAIARRQLESKIELRGEGIGEPSLRLLRLEVEAAPPPQSVNRSVPASAGLVTLDGLEIPAGMLVEIRATGSYRIGSWNDATIGPQGYPGGGPQDYNLPGSVFRNAKHGAAVALLQRDSAAQAVVVGACVQFVAQSGGTLRVGVNDKDYQNNSGKLSFDVRVTTPNAETWAQGAPKTCVD